MSSTTSTTALPFSGLSFQDFGNRFTGFGTFGKKVGIGIEVFHGGWRPIEINFGWGQKGNSHHKVDSWEKYGGLKQELLGR